MTDVERLFADHQHLARTTACALLRRLRGRVPLDELENAALEGLWQAAGRFDPGLGVGFPAFADRRMTGAMLDWVRQSSPFSRGQQQARRRGEGPALPVSLDALPQWREPAAPAASDSVELADLAACALRCLPSRMRRRVIVYYLEYQTYESIARSEGRSKSGILLSLQAACKLMRDTLTITPAQREAVREYLGPETDR